MATLRIEHARFAGCALTLGEHRHALEDEPVYYDNNPALLARLKKSIGFGTRYIADARTTAADLCADAAERLLNSLDCPSGEVGAVISVTQTPDYSMPGNAHILHRRLKLSPSAPAFDMEMGCSGFVYGLAMSALLASQGVDNVLLVTGDTLSRKVDPADRTIAPLFGDAGSAALVRHDSKAPSMYFLLCSDGQGLKNMYVPSGGCRNPLGAAQKADDLACQDTLFMNGFGIFEFTMTEQPRALAAILSYAGKKLEDIDYFLFHQANKYIVRTIADKAGIDEAKAPSNIFPMYGNLNAASIPAVLCADLAQPLAGRRAQVVMQGFGIGLSWGACQAELDRPLCLPPVRLGGAHA